ncbi:MAG: hypothetical protein H7Y33_18955 [Cytophagales bacterium]|nr:hypothetical protein [Rhizobacter sp.]
MSQPALVQLEGPAFTPLVKALASALVLGMAFYGWRVLPQLLAQRSSWVAWVFLLMMVVFVLVCYAWILRSRTSISESHIHQTWVTDKQVALADITQIKLIHIPRLAWLISPRLMVKTRMPGTMVFHTADPQVLAAFDRLATSRPPST